MPKKIAFVKHSSESLYNHVVKYEFLVSMFKIFSTIFRFAISYGTSLKIFKLNLKKINFYLYLNSILSILKILFYIHYQ